MDVLCVGILVADTFGTPIDTIPEKARLQLFDRMELHIGGCAANTGIALAKLGAWVGVIGKVGCDGFGEFVRRTLLSHQVNADGVVRDSKTSTAFTFIMVASDGERRFLHTFGANATFCADDIDLELVKKAKILHVAGTYLMPTLDGEQTARILKAAKDAGVTTCMDTAFNDRIEDWASIMEPCFPYLDIFIPSVEEAEKITGLTEPKEMVRYFRSKGCSIAGVKLGSGGCHILADDGEAHIPIYKVDAVDTSGAGDSWAAGFLTGLLKGWGTLTCAKFGNAVAAHCVQAVGCTAGVKSLDEILAFQKGRD